MLLSALGRFRTVAAPRYLSSAPTTVSLRQLTTIEKPAAAAAAAAGPTAPTGPPLPEVPTRVFGTLPKKSKKYAKLDKQRIRAHLRRLQPKLEATGTTQTSTFQHESALSASSSFDQHSSSSLTLETMMAAGMHLGHSASLWNPMNLPYIFGEREGIHVINLEVTMAALRRSAHFVRQVAYHGGLVLFAGARKDHRQMAVDAALLAEQYFVTGKWIPGTLTNPRPLLGKHIMYVEEIWDVAEAKDFANYTTPANAAEEEAELAGGKRGGRKSNTRYLKMVEEEKAKLKKEGDGLKTYKPDLIIALNPLECKTMLAECKLAHVPTVGIVDTNCDPRLVTYPVPCNDDSMRAVAIVAGVLARAAKEGMDMRKLRLGEAVRKHHAVGIEKAAAEAGRAERMFNE
ncbi:hypothetical protein LPJ66_001813 [Kickxella alabastrina]|uniref:Uncharacterized protein n=1 Tax=Kickxella alabastrina TaxID=61397 RepID=A0ACC1IS85_9FUNG|nr:hypothetical protein LPJ66_001813 [Kickxella alabastrina]